MSITKTDMMVYLRGMQMNIINLLLYQRPPKRFAIAVQNSDKLKTHNYKYK